MESDLEFYARGALEELQAADRAVIEPARNMHLELAETYKRKAEEARHKASGDETA